MNEWLPSFLLRLLRRPNESISRRAILVAFLASYLTAVLTAVVPPPMDLLCKLKLGFCPVPVVLEFGATDIDRIVDRDGVGQGLGEQTDRNASQQDHSRPNERRNSVTYQVNDSPAGKYCLRILYAAASSRPVDILVNNELVQQGALYEQTGDGTTTIGAGRQVSGLL